MGNIWHDLTDAIGMRLGTASFPAMILKVGPADEERAMAMCRAIGWILPYPPSPLVKLERFFGCIFSKKKKGGAGGRQKIKR